MAESAARVAAPAAGGGFTDTEIHAGVQRIFAWTGLAMLVSFLVGLWPIARFVPALHPPAQGCADRAVLRDAHDRHPPWTV
jgi:hypothetical protein